jgi:alpha-tubulin suppressor-like RCC1 family protein
MDIAPYYLNSETFKNMTENENLQNVSIESLINSVRDDSPIRDKDDLLYTLACLSYWNIESIPQIIFDYVDKNLLEDYLLDEDLITIIFPSYIETIEDYIKTKFNSNKTIACGKYHTVGIREDRTIVTWGSNIANQRDNPPSGKFISIACGAFHSVGIREDGTIVTWGDNRYHQRDNSPSGKFISIACGAYHSVGIREDGIVFTWGDNGYHQRDDTPSGKFISIACGAYHSIGIREDGIVFTWGDNSNNQRDNPPSGKFI